MAITEKIIVDLRNKWLGGKSIQGDLFNIAKVSKSAFDPMFLAVDLYREISALNKERGEAFYKTLQARFNATF